VPKTRTVSAGEALAAVHTSHLPDGAFFDPRRTALIETPLAFDFSNVFDRLRSTARIARLGETTVEVETSAPTAAFLILSDVYYPGWQAEIDSRPTQIYQTDYTLRGVALPAGAHRVRFHFAPRSFYFGALITVLCLIAAIVPLLRARFFSASGW